MPELLPEVKLSQNPTCVVMLVEPGLETEAFAQQAVEIARLRMPRVTGGMASTLQPLHGDTHFGIYFPDRKTWFLEQGTRPFTMRNLPRGKAIPMWVNDPDGSVARGEKGKKRPKTRITEDGRRQTQIFRVVAPDKSRKTAMRNDKVVSVPRSYPGAPGRIASRAGGRIAGGNVGVRWRHPGIRARQFLNTAMADTVLDQGIEPTQLFVCDTMSFFHLIKG